MATSEISLFLLVSVAEKTGLDLTLSETPKTGFLALRPIIFNKVSVEKNCFCCMLHDATADISTYFSNCVERKVYNNDHITFFSQY